MEDQEVVLVRETLRRQNGLLFASPAIVHRGSYAGRDIIAPNSRPEYADERGYLPVEWWIVSKTQALNEIQKEGEGLSHLLILASPHLTSSSGESEEISSSSNTTTQSSTGPLYNKVLFSHLAKVMEKELLGTYGSAWPLIKLLDIGGQVVTPSFASSAEVPPIPLHVHAGELNPETGKLEGCGKLEAYFFPPLDVPPYNTRLDSVISRLGLRPEVTPAMLLDGVRRFGQDDSAYQLCNVFDVKPYEGWTIRPKVVHSPGPYPTIEMQLPQDDFHFCCWQLGRKIDSEDDRKAKRDAFVLKGFPNEEAMLQQAVDFHLSSDAQFRHRNHRPSIPLDSGDWGKRYQIFFDEFYAESIEVNPGCRYVREEKEGRPCAGIVWSGKGSVNGNEVDVNKPLQKEFLVVPATTQLEIASTGDTRLILFLMFPFAIKDHY
jgi:hypothetical protein